ncbi:helix-turn-helix domain-containing protein [Sporolactobacillus pectinivorans]|uniref:helix-turn-helix domain-containing protein n=1 Tax=Sporolactobacillus pectinivorans TaxID=1591408 RepID=UPI000C26387C|nr:helix-turn-helix transcriptional regulator [Sporolactobacillus pectinivorans]
MADTLGSRIGEFRKRKGITQDQLAEHIGVSSQAVSKWENDLSCPDISSLPQLADYFNVSVDELLRGEKSKVVQVVSEGERKDFNKMLLKVSVDSEEGDIVRVNLPLGLVKVALEIGTQLPQISGNDALKNIDFQAILLMAENGVIGKIVEVKSANGDNVEVVIE